jgi:hypothetical protein
MREVRSSLTALLVVAGGTAWACGSDDPLTGDAPDRSENVNAATTDGGKGGSKGSKGDAGTIKGSSADGGKVAPSSAMPSNCGKSGFSTGIAIPDMMIVLDRSGSMKPGSDGAALDCRKTDFVTVSACTIAGVDCSRPADAMTAACGGSTATNRWDPSVNALESLTAKFDSMVSFGLMTFPDAESRDNCAAGGIQVPIGLGTSGAIKMKLDGMQPGGGTPTGATLEAALKGFQETAVAGDVVQPARYVLLVTDGQPTCPNAEGGRSGNAKALEADKQLTLKAIDALAAEGIKTFVVGYDAALDPKFATALTEFAQHGGTDDYFPVQNEDSLSTAFASISQKVATCAFAFKSTIDDPTTIRVTLDGKLLRPNDPDGWVVEGKSITVQGASCDILQGDEGHRVEIVVECEPVIYL